MSSLQLPQELWHQVLQEAYTARGWKRGQRLRLVSKSFAKEVTNLLIRTNTLDEYIFAGGADCAGHRPFFITHYLLHRSLKEPDDGHPMFVLIRRVARQLVIEMDVSALESEKRYQEILESLCLIVGQSLSLRRVFDVTESIKAALQLPTHVFCAAVALDLKSVVYRMREQYNTSQPKSLLFYTTSKHIEEKGLSYMVDMFPDRDVCDMENAVRHGHFDLVKKLHDKEASRHAAFGTPDPARFNQWNSTETHRRSLDKWLYTPSIEVFNFIMEVRQTTEKRRGPIPPWLLILCLYQAARNGWLDMARHLILLGVDVNGSFSANDMPAIVRACKAGQTEMVQLLLEHGAEIRGSVMAAAANCHASTMELLFRHGAEVSEPVIVHAAKHGRMTLVKTLLDRGADPNTGTPHPLISAISLEHTRMFELLLERGATLDGKVGRECVKVAKAEGLESMLELLKSKGVDIEHTDTIEEIQEDLEQLSI